MNPSSNDSEFKYDEKRGLLLGDKPFIDRYIEL